MRLPGLFDINTNLLPADGVLTYSPSFYEYGEADQLFNVLNKEIAWKAEKIRLYGKEHDVPRLTAWYGDPGKSYTYSKIRNEPNTWTETLLTIKKKIETYTGHKFNSLLLNLYRSGKDHVSWHADDETELGDNPIIASLSLGDIRRFQLKHKTNKEFETVTLELEPGSLVIMEGEVQKKWLHRIASTKNSVGPRMNLTFRFIY